MGPPLQPLARKCDHNGPAHRGSSGWTGIYHCADGEHEPTLDENSVVAVETVVFGQLRQGDIVIYRNSAGVPIVHRLYEPANGSWIVLGDNNPSVTAKR